MFTRLMPAYEVPKPVDAVFHVKSKHITRATPPLTPIRTSSSSSSSQCDARSWCSLSDASSVSLSSSGSPFLGVKQKLDPPADDVAITVEFMGRLLIDIPVTSDVPWYLMTVGAIKTSVASQLASLSASSYSFPGAAHPSAFALVCAGTIYEDDENSLLELDVVPQRGPDGRLCVTFLTVDVPSVPEDILPTLSVPHMSFEFESITLDEDAGDGSTIASGFSISHASHGTVVWHAPVPLPYRDRLDVWVAFERGRVSFSPSCPCGRVSVTLRGLVWVGEGESCARAQLTAACDALGATFRSYDPVKGEWAFDLTIPRQ